MYKNLLIFLILFYQVATAQQLNYTQQSLNKANNSFFIENKGQWTSEVKYLARIGGMNAWITNSGVVYDYYKVNKNIDETKTLKMNSKERIGYGNKNTTIQGHVVKLQLVNHKNNIAGVGNDQHKGYYNYFIGNDQSKWANDVSLYDNVELQGVYKDINVKYYFDNGTLRYDYKVQPGADISQIKFKCEGQDGISINSSGELVLKISIGKVTNGKMFAYQMEGGTQKEVPCKFEQKDDNTIGLKAESYDATKELIIDPLVYSTFIGGNGLDEAQSIAIDDSGNAYLTGFTTSSNFPIITGAYQATSNNSNEIAFVTKLNSSGSDLVYSTFIGGNFVDKGNSIAIDTSGNAYITGMASSSNFPTTNGSYQTTIGSFSGNAFVTKLNPGGSALVYSTFIGGNVYDYANSIAVDTSGYTYITGYTGSSNFPTTNGSYQTTYSGGNDVFVTKLNPSGSALAYSTFIGGTNRDNGTSIAIDANRNAYITGLTTSSDYPITQGAYQTTFGGGYDDAFVTKLNSSGSALVYSTFIGGNEYDQSNSITIDASGNAYITGIASSSNFPTTNGAYQTTIGSFSGNAFVTKLNPSGSALIYSTFIGGNEYDQSNSITIDVSGNAYITGVTSSSNFPTTNGSYQTTYSGGNDAFVTKLNSSGSTLLYSTFIGGNVYDYANSIAVDTSGYTYITGYTSSSNFPTTNGAYQITLGGNQNVFITKLKIFSAMFVQPNSSSIPNKFEIFQNYPNPFNPNTIIGYTLPFRSNVKIEIYNILGERIKELLNEYKDAGFYEVFFNTTGLSSGIYFYMIEAKSMDGISEFRDTKKMVLLK